MEDGAGELWSGLLSYTCILVRWYTYYFNKIFLQRFGENFLT